MNAVNQPVVLAKLSWQDPQTGETRDLFLQEGGSASIGRLDNNEICIKEQHVSRQHAIIDYRDGVFFITDNDSANGVFINDERITEPYPLIAGDVIRLYVPQIKFDAVTLEEQQYATERITGVVSGIRRGQLIIASGLQEGTTIALRWDSLRVGRATANAEWEICLPDPSVSRPHARMDYVDNNWIVYDLGSSNGTFVNGSPINEKGRVLHDGDQITFGTTLTLFHAG
ncbi:MAG: FHA domain-containing protein [Anaerolinea sp.]|nr:FHA domain-containing protein [Anaerolinea sp.]